MIVMTSVITGVDGSGHNAGPMHRLEASLLFGAFAAFGCGSRDQPQAFADPASGPPAAVLVHEPEQLTSVDTGKVDALGRPLRAACVSCHTVRKPAALPTNAEALQDFHKGLRFEHGPLSCAACHELGAQETLHLADGRSVPMRDAMLLCGQCHGPQHRDYLHGAHGGMSGHWDLRRGGRLRNHCVDCHDPHAPHFAPTEPVLPPRDRRLTPSPDLHRDGAAIPRLSGKGGRP